MIGVDTAIFKLDHRTEQRILADFNYITKQYDNEKTKYETGERSATVRSEKELG